MPSYLSYKNNVKVVMDADDDNIESWITVRGNHIPIMKGESKEEAVKNFLAKKSDKEMSQRSNKPEHISKAANKVVKQTAENRKVYKEAKEPEQFASKYLKRAMNSVGKEKWEKMPYAEKAEAIKKEKDYYRTEGRNLYFDTEKGYGIRTDDPDFEKQFFEEYTDADKEDFKDYVKGFNSVGMTNEEPEYKEKYPYEFEVVRKNALANSNVYEGRYAQKSKAEAYKEYEDDMLWHKAWRNVEEQERIANLAPGGPDGVFYTDFLSPSEMAEYEKEKEEKIKAEFERLKAEKAKSEKFDYGTGWPKSPKFEKLTKQYMPTTGESDNEFGEMLRSINRATYRYYNDGDIWNKGYGKETVNAAVKHLTELSKKKDIPLHISRGLENGLYELKNAGKNKDKYETGLKLLLQTVEFAPEADINAMLKMKRNNGN